MATERQGTMSFDDLDGLSVQLTSIKNRRYGFDEYSHFIKPSDFVPVLPCTFYKDSNNVVQHNMDFDIYKTNYVEIYLDSDNGNDTSGNGTENLPYKSLQKCFDIAEAGVGTDYIIYVVNTFITRSDASTTKTITKNISIVGLSSEKSNITSANTALSWTLDGVDTWKTSRTATTSIFNFSTTDENGEYIPLEKVSSLALCQASAETWYTDNTYVWVHTESGLVPTINTYMVIVSSNCMTVTITSDAVLYIENVRFVVGTTGGHKLSFTGDGSLQGSFIANNCSFLGGVSAGNALTIESVENAYLFDCICAYAGRDGFNYHFSLIDDADKRDCFVLEYNCKAYLCGISPNTDTSGTNNCTTCHNGASIIRFNADGDSCEGPVLADANGCYSIIVDTSMVNTLLESVTDYATSYYFDNTDSIEDGKVILIQCIDGGDIGYSVSSPNTEFDIWVYNSNFTNDYNKVTPTII